MTFALPHFAPSCRQIGLACLSWSLLTASIAVAPGCAADSPSEPEPGISVRPPLRPEAAPAGDGEGTMYAITRFDIGARSASGVESGDAWQAFGYDLDELITVDDFDNHCTAAAGANPSNVFPDGPGGIDNAFGKLLLPILRFAANSSNGEVEDSINDALGGATSGLLIHLRNMGTEANYDPIDAYIYRVDGLESGGWAISESSVSDLEAPDFDAVLRTGKARFGDSYVRSSVWVSGEGTGSLDAIDLIWNIAGQPLRLRVHQPTVTMKVGATPGVTSGVIAGVLRTEEAVDQVRRWITSSSTSFCDGAAVEDVLNQLRQMSDMQLGETQSAGAECNGISIGIGFQAEPTTVSEISAESLSLDPCL